MSVQYIIDGYNLINHHLFPLRRKGSADPAILLLRFIRSRRLTGSPKNQVLLVFDGYPGKQAAEPDGAEASFIYAKSQTADEKIKRIVETSSHPRNILVVSDDKEIRFVVRALGARPVSIEEFIVPELEGGVRSGARKKKHEEDTLKQELTFTQANQINQELRRLWL